MAASDPELWKYKVRAARICVPRGTQAHRDAHQARVAMNMKFMVQIKQTLTVKQQNNILWMKKVNFVAWHGLWEAMDAAAAAKKFDALVADPRTDRMEIPGDEIRIGVMDIPRTGVVRKRTLEAALVRDHGTLESEAAVAAAAAELAKVGTGTLGTAINGDTFGPFAEAAFPKGLAGSLTGQVLPAMSLAENSGPAMGAIVPPGHWTAAAPPVRDAAAASDGAAAAGSAREPQTKPKKPVAKALRGCTDEVQAARTVGLNAIAQLQKEFSGMKGMASKMRSAFTRAQVTIEPQTQDILTCYDRALDRLKTGLQ